MAGYGWLYHSGWETDQKEEEKKGNRGGKEMVKQKYLDKAEVLIERFLISSVLIGKLW